MASSLIWITGASGGIGQALVETVPWSDANVAGIGRRPARGARHLAADLSDPASWAVVGDDMTREVAGFVGERVIFIQAAGTLEPIGFAGEVDADAYRRNVLLNSAAFQVLGGYFLAATASLGNTRRQMLILGSGAAHSVYPGWSSYGAAKAAVDQWVRDVGAEQEIRGGAEVLSVAPGTVDTPMQAAIREVGDRDFSQRGKFVDLHQSGALSDPVDVARSIWDLLSQGRRSGSVLDLRDLSR